jgi:prepilin-type N-terminal cleavage/methylation domain-containing protein
MKRERGFTIVEVIIAIIVFTVGLLGLVTTSALVTRMIGRGQRSANAATFASKRLELLRVTGCRSQAAGKDTLYTQTGTAVAINSWGFTNATNSHWAIVDTVKYQTSQGAWRTDIMETQVSCLF